MTQHLTPEEFMRNLGLGGAYIYDEYLCDLLAKYHDHALEVAAERAEVEATEYDLRDKVKTVETCSGFTISNSNGSDAFRVSKQSILNLKINK